jgi:SAM-dependent methyltransferase
MIVSWYRQNVNDFGYWRATSLLWRVAWGRAAVKASNALLAKRFECPCCGWEGRRLFDYLEMGYTVRNASCPQCDSHSRHRTFFLWLRDQYEIEKVIGTAVIFAPERALEALWQRAKALRTVKLDIEPSRGVDVIGDIMRLPLPSQLADLVWCHHVLDQVPDDRVALSELNRILKSTTGDLIISAGESTSPATREFGTSDKALSGNRRSYGADFPDRLRAAGFSVQVLDGGLSDIDRHRYALNNEQFYLCRKDRVD